MEQNERDIIYLSSGESESEGIASTNESKSESTSQTDSEEPFFFFTCIYIY
jgi:hypothetical protein